mmetsp:Transcript_31717/g.79755  ORF Transcript_31717/g.79755 Transcript_31717/m.79755 type:complete len:220 (-) Transcript_31717:11-670(-)
MEMRAAWQDKKARAARAVSRKHKHVSTWCQASSGHEAARGPTSAAAGGKSKSLQSDTPACMSERKVRKACPLSSPKSRPQITLPSKVKNWTLLPMDALHSSGAVSHSASTSSKVISNKPGKCGGLRIQAGVLAATCLPRHKQNLAPWDSSHPKQLNPQAAGRQSRGKFKSSTRALSRCVGTSSTSLIQCSKSTNNKFPSSLIPALICFFVAFSRCALTS